MSPRKTPLLLSSALGLKVIPRFGGRGTSIVTGGQTCWRTSERITQEIGLCCSSHAVLGLGILSE